MAGTEGWWKFRVPQQIDDIQNRVEEIVLAPEAYNDIYKVETEGLCACGEGIGAAYYARKHNHQPKEGKTHPLLITFRAKDFDVYVDCRDFLVTAFQLFDRHSAHYLDEQRQALATLFGSAVLKYFDLSCKSEEQQIRIGLANIACFDRAVIEAHYENRRFIAGRHKTQFCSAFFVKAPVLPGDILSVDSNVEFNPPNTAYSLDSFFSGIPI